MSYTGGFQDQRKDLSLKKERLSCLLITSFADSALPGQSFSGMFFISSSFTLKT
jgi:hypothetical protein